VHKVWGMAKAPPTGWAVRLDLFTSH
jgi:hypothetical protein